MEHTLEFYSNNFPNLPIEITLFFNEFIKAGEQSSTGKTVSHFCDYYSKKYKLEGMLQPRVIASICEKLVNEGRMTRIQSAGIDGMFSRYYVRTDDTLLVNEQLQALVNEQLSFIIYGFPKVLSTYKTFVLPVEFTNQLGDISLGTCFLFQGGIISAKHCFEHAKKIKIKGIGNETLKDAKFWIHENELMDVVFIKFENDFQQCIWLSSDALILDDVITLGYPKVPGYHNFLAAESARVSSRFTASIGDVTAIAEDIWIKEKLILITAKIRGGNSGGPVINRKGEVIGVSVNMSFSEGNYDDLGYGTVIPIHFVQQQIMYAPKRQLNTSNIIFENFD